MTVKLEARPRSRRRVGTRWGLLAKSTRGAGKTSYCCRGGQHGKCSNLSCTCPCH